MSAIQPIIPYPGNEVHTKITRVEKFIQCIALFWLCAMVSNGPKISHLNITLFVGADITDYFNYGFTEDTWKQYCEKQRRMRLELSMQKKIFVRKIVNHSRVFPSVQGRKTVPNF